MKNSRGLTIVGASLLLAAKHADAQTADQSKTYLDVALGPAIQQDVSIKNSPFGNSGKMKFNTGLRANVNLGYDFTESFAAEFETGVIWNSVDSIHGNSLSGLGASADIYEIPILASVVYKPLHGAFQPYISAGCGGVETLFDSSNIPLFSSSFSDSDFNFAYQGAVGFKYCVSEHVELGLAYQFLGTTSHEWSDQGVTLKTDGTMTHAIMATFTWRF